MRPYLEPEPGQTPLPYVASVSWPRSGHHLIVRLLYGYFGPRFGYCEYHVPKDDPDTPCCGHFPCQKRAIAFSKNHDFNIDSPVPTDVPLLVQWREPIAALHSNFELAVMEGWPDTPKAFTKFGHKQAEKYRRFMAKWVEPDLPNRLVLNYDDLTADPHSHFRKVLTLWGEDPCDEAKLETAIQTVPHISVSDKTSKLSAARGVRAERVVTTFRHYDAAETQVFREIALGPVAAHATTAAVIAPHPAAPATARTVDPETLKANRLRAGERLVFHHIPKCAGSSVSDLLAAPFRKDQIFRHRGDMLPGMSAEEVAKYRYFTGHFSRHGVDTVPGPKRVVTVLREPRERILSLYYFWRSHTHAAIERGNLKGARAAKSMDLKTFLRSDLPEVTLSINNHIVRSMLGPIRLELGQGFRLPDRDFAVDTAILNIKRYFFVAFTETLDEDMAQLLPLLGIEPVATIPREKAFENLSARKALFEPIEREPLDDETWSLLNHLTFLDMAFYRKAWHLRASLRCPYPM
ncbi:MAG: sulfotransferase family 2 domain-containing protein [Pseudomonadota bacterium]